MSLKFFSFSILLFTAVFSAQLFAQNQDSTAVDNSYYFDDGGISEAKNIFKINLVPIVSGDLPFFYERLLSDSYSVEVGFGILMPFYNPDVSAFINEEDDGEINDPDWSTSWRVGIRYYLLNTAPENTYVGIQYRRRNYRLDRQNIIHKDIHWTFGYQYNPWNRFTIDFGIGLGFRFTETENSDSDDIGLVMPIAFKVGVLL